MSFRIWYDDDYLEIIDKVNEELKKEKIPVHIDHEDEAHDGFDIFTLIKENL